LSSTDIEMQENSTPAQAGAEPTHSHAEDHAHDGHSHAGHDHAGHTHAAPALNPECTRTVQVEVSAEEVSAEFAAVLKRYRKLARIPGFRAGKVPEAVLRRKFADGLRQDVLEALLPKHLGATLEAQGLQPISQPQVSSLHLAEGEPLRCMAVFEVLPSIDVTGYAEVKVEVPNVALTEEEVREEIARIQDSHATMETIAEERALADGDFAVIRFQGQVQGADADVPARPIEGEDATVEIGGKNTVEAFTLALRGAKVGQQMQFDVTYPAEFSEPRLAGKTVSYDVEVKSLQKKNLPALDDALASQLGEFASFAEFEEKLRERLAGQKRRHMEGEAKDKLLEALAARFSFPVPESLVQQQVDVRLDRGLRALAAQGMTTEQMRKLDFDRLRAAQRDSALEEIKGLLILDRIADLESVALTEEEVEQQLLMLSYQSREPMDALRKRLTEDGGLNRIREQLRREKTIDLLYARLTA
jgi:trigger factor